MSTVGLVIVVGVFCLLFFGLAHALTRKGSGIYDRSSGPGGGDEERGRSSGGALSSETGASEASRKGGTKRRGTK